MEIAAKKNPIWFEIVNNKINDNHGGFMNVKLVEYLAPIVQSLSTGERSLLEEKLSSTPDLTSAEEQDRPFYETATPEEWARAFREWAESHPRKSRIKLHL